MDASDVGEPFSRMNLGLFPAVVQGQGHTEESSQFAIEVGQGRPAAE